MSKIDQSTMLLIALQAIGEEWAERRLPNELLSDEPNLRLLIAIEDFLWSRNAQLTPQTVKRGAPTFYEQFGSAMLRELGKPFGHPREGCRALA